MEIQFLPTPPRSRSPDTIGFSRMEIQFLRRLKLRLHATKVGGLFRLMLDWSRRKVRLHAAEADGLLEQCRAFGALFLKYLISHIGTPTYQASPTLNLDEGHQARSLLTCNLGSHKTRAAISSCGNGHY